MKTIKPLMISAFVALLISSCGSTAVISTPIENIDSSPLRVSELTENEKQNWGHLDLVKDTIPGMSINKAYEEIIKDKKGQAVIVAVIDTGIDIDHEDLDDVIWKNRGEIPNNGKDDDNNGYIDDVHGWNFLGDAYDEQLEYTRLLAKGDIGNPDYARAQREYIENHNKYSELKSTYDQILQQINFADEIISKHLGKEEYTIEDVAAMEAEDQQLQQSVAIINYYVKDLDLESVSNAKKTFNDDLVSINNRLNFHLNKEFKGRKTGDDPDDFSQKIYGNNNVKPVKKSESHGTHVAGIIAAERNNEKGVNGVTNNVKIMPIRTIPNGDEYDKDVALAIRYAVDNGAKIINGSFGKYYSPHSDWTRDAIAYASKKDVLFVVSAGNESNNIDIKTTYPNDVAPKGGEVSSTFLLVGALASKYGSGMVADFSNYGKVNVDVMAPGGKIYATNPESEYGYKSGTSMASPGVAGVAALIRSYYPKLTAAQVKQILMDSGLPVTPKVVVGGNADDVRPFESLTKSARIVNAYNALIMAANMSKK